MRLLKKLVLSLAIIGLTTACREQNTPIEPSRDVVDPNATVKVTGMFEGANREAVSGTAKIVQKDGKYSLVFDNFNSVNGPNLHVYLSNETSPKNFLDLGLLKSVSGTQVYELKETAEAPQYKYALIYCQQYSKLFGSALLK